MALGEMAKWEDTWGFLADGTGTYDSKSGVCKTADTLTFKIQLTAGNSRPSNVALADFRSLRAKVDQAAYNNAAYYMHRTMEALLVSFNSATNATPYIASGPNGPTLDGFPIRWVGVMARLRSDRSPEPISGRLWRPLLLVPRRARLHAR